VVVARETCGLNRLGEFKERLDDLRGHAGRVGRPGVHPRLLYSEILAVEQAPIQRGGIRL